VSKFIAFIDGQPLQIEADDIHHATEMLSRHYDGQNVRIEIEPAGSRDLLKVPTWSWVGAYATILAGLAMLIAVTQGWL
jgi:hypothetical protein